jgi:hypothetical protein
MYQRSECSNKPIAVQIEGERLVEKPHHFNSLYDCDAGASTANRSGAPHGWVYP